MLCLEIGGEYFDEHKQEFVYLKPKTIKLEHSLISISKWESKHHVPFLTTEMSDKQMKDYIKCMTISRDIDDKDYEMLSEENIDKIVKYIDDPMTATTFNDSNNAPRSREIITSEIIYYWMIEYRIPVEFEKWHLNRLLALIKVINIKHAPARKMSRGEVMARNRALNEARRKANHSKG